MTWHMTERKRNLNKHILYLLNHSLMLCQLMLTVKYSFKKNNKFSNESVLQQRKIIVNYATTDNQNIITQCNVRS